MKFETILKSVVIAGLLAGVSDANAAKLKGREGCHLLYVKNDSHTKSNDSADKDTDYVVEANFISCNDANHENFKKALVQPKEERMFCVEPGTKVWMERRLSKDSGNTKTAHIDNSDATIDEGWRYILTGTVDSVASRHDMLSDADKTSPAAKQCLKIEK